MQLPLTSSKLETAD